MEGISLVIADDHPLLLEGLKNHLEHLNYNILASVGDGSAAIKAIIDHKPDLAILDVEMPYFSGIEVIKTCIERGIKTHLVLLTFHKEPAYIARAKRLDIAGYLLKDDAIDEVDSCIKTIMGGEKYYSHAIRGNEYDYLEEDLHKISTLTPSQKKILKLVASGLTTKEIASKLFISERTVEKHRSNIISALNINTHGLNLNQWAEDNKHLLEN